MHPEPSKEPSLLCIVLISVKINGLMQGQMELTMYGLKVILPGIHPGNVLHISPHSYWEFQWVFS